MANGDGPVKQKKPPTPSKAVASAERKSLWERLKPVWWMRGVLGAIALVGFFDQLGWVREGWLPVFHAFATRWNDVVAWLAKTLSIALPFDWEITTAEGHFLTVFFALILPATIPAVRFLLSPPRVRRSALVVAAFIAVATPMVIATVLPGETWMIGGDAPYFGAVMIVLSLTAIFVARRFNKPYFKALVLTLTFLATLEVFYLAPFIQKALQPIVDRVTSEPTAIP